MKPAQRLAMFTSLPTMSEFTLAVKSSRLRSRSSTPAAEPRRVVVAQVLGGQVIEPGARRDERAARLRHLLAVDRQEAVREDRRRRPVAGAREHRGPEQRVEIDDVLADEVVHLGVAAGLPVAVEIAARAAAVLQQARQVADRRVEPDVEVLACLAGNLEAEVRLVARDVPVAQPRAEPFVELGGHRRLQPPGAGPFAQHRLEVAELEEQVLGLALHGRGAAHDRDRVDQVGRRVGGAADFAAVAVLVERAAASGRCRARSGRAGTSSPARRRPGAIVSRRMWPAADEPAVDLVR